MDLTAVTAEVVAGLFAIITTILGLAWGRQKMELSTVSAELDSKRQSLALRVDLGKWDKVETQMDKLVKGGCIDRILVLRCWNGWRDPSYTTAVYQWRAEGQESVHYISVPLDDGYISRINSMNDDGSHTIDVQAHQDIIPHELIIRIYMSEEVKHAIWFPVASHELNLPRYLGWLRWFGIKIKAHTYASFATHEDEPIPVQTYQKCQNMVYMMKDAVLDG